MPIKPHWKEGHPRLAGCPGFFFVCDDEGNKTVVEIDVNEKCTKAHGIGKIVAYCGPITEPDDETLP